MFSAATRRSFKPNIAVVLKPHRFSSVYLSTSAPAFQAVESSNNKTDEPVNARTSAATDLNVPSQVSTNTTSFTIADSARSWTKTNASAFIRYADGVSFSARTELAQIGKRINKLTGYNEIEKLKTLVGVNGGFSLRSRCSVLKKEQRKQDAYRP